MKAYARSIFHLFDGKRRYIVPLFQRQYVWNREKQWEPLWEDISRVAGRRVEVHTGPPHFLGAMVLDQIRTYGNQIPAHLIIDGQQRLTTFQILLAALRDVARNGDAIEFAEEIQRYLENTGIMENREQERFKIWPTRVNLVPPLSEGRKPSTKKPLHFPSSPTKKKNISPLTISPPTCSYCLNCRQIKDFS